LGGCRGLMTMEFEALLTENQIAVDFLAGLERRYVPEKFFYWFPLSVRAWLDLCEASQPYRNYSRSFQLIARHASEIASACPASEIEVVSLGAGQGDKDILLLDALRSRGKAVFYQPADASQALLEMAVLKATDAGFRARGLKADVEDARTAHWLSKTAAYPRLYLILGNSLGITDPSNFLRWLRGLLRPADWILLDGEIYSPASTMRGYDNPANRRFAFAPLASVGLAEGEDGELVFTLESDARFDGIHRVRKFFQAARRLKFAVAGKWIELDEGEKILMSPSWKYSRGAFDALVREAGGLEPELEFLADDEHFVMVLAHRQDS
jgi:uncharacterized SAM-dependent methyltransferase